MDINRKDTLKRAHWWIEKGIAVIPLVYRGKKPAADALKLTGCVESGRPVWAPFQERLPTDEELRCWFTGPRRNIGVVTGWEGLVVIDFDSQASYDLWRVWAAREKGVAYYVSLFTYQVQTRRGVHLYLQVEEPVKPFKVPVVNVDVKAAGGYVLGVPSVHPTGHQYKELDSTHVILPVSKLSEVLPLAPPIAGVRTDTEEPRWKQDDPWEAAMHAVNVPPGSIEDIRARVQIKDLLGFAGRSRGQWTTICPLHREQEPSFVVYPDGHFYCFGCQAYGDVIDLYARLHGVSVREAIGELA